MFLQTTFKPIILFTKNILCLVPIKIFMEKICVFISKEKRVLKKACRENFSENPTESWFENYK